VKRREFIAGPGSAAAWPLAARAQAERVRRIGVLMGTLEGDLETRLRAAAFQQELEKLGWVVGRLARAAAMELLGLAPDLILVNPVAGLRALQQATRTIPIVFVSVSEPVAQGFVSSLARPGGNITGFSYLEPTIGAKWLQFLKQVAPQTTRVAVMLNPDTTPFNVAFSRSAEAAAPKFAIEATFAPVHEIAQIEAVMTTLGHEPGGGLIVPTDTYTIAHSDLIIEQAARHRIPAIYGLRSYVIAGGLLSYGADTRDIWRSSASYADRILRGAKAANLPVQQPTKFELVINTKTANAVRLTVPPTLLAFADEIIQ
jgi:putative tryptophan/tyrosine transport system substrate-binding protein